MGQSSQQRSLTLALTAVIGTLVLDQVSKEFVLRELGPEAARRFVEIFPWFHLIFVRNTGSAFGMFQGQSSILTVLTFGAIGLLVLFFYRNARNDPLIATALGLQVGGALGNLVDRLRHGYVVDWIDVSRWPTFNIADSAITVGVALLLYAIIVRDLTRVDQPDEETGRMAARTTSDRQ